MVLFGTTQEGFAMADPKPPKTDDPRRQRIQAAVWEILLEGGPERLSTAELARRAGVSKRELYGLFGNKSALLADCVAARTQEMRRPLAAPPKLDGAALRATLGAFGTAVLRTVTSPAVLALYRLALAEAERAPEIAMLIETNGRNANRAALAKLLAHGQDEGLLAEAKPEAMASTFMSLIWDDLLVRLLLGTARPPGSADIARRVSDALDSFMRLYGLGRSPHPRAAARATRG
jgi:AcrR family transcriptional regulator